MRPTSQAVRVTMLAGSFEHDAEDSLRVLTGYLRENAPIIDTRLIAYQSEDDDPSLRLLDEETDCPSRVHEAADHVRRAAGMLQALLCRGQAYRRYILWY